MVARDQLFATLDPTMRHIKLPSGRSVILSDTVGFVSDLPHELVAAFRATLEEVLAADVVIHVRDIAHPESEAQAHDVAQVLGQIGIDPHSPEHPVLEALNKIDLLDAEARMRVLGQSARNPNAAAVSAVSGEEWTIS